MKTLARCLALVLITFQVTFVLPTTGGLQRRDDQIAIVNATIVDGTGNAPFVGTVIIRGDRIVAIGQGIQVPRGARTIRADGQTLIPGLFDLHTHLPYATAGGVSADWPKNLKAYLYCGVTSVVDFGVYPEMIEPMRRLISAGSVEAPRLSLAARMTTPGGHGAEGGRGDFFTLEVLTPREARAAVQRVLPYKPDVIKVFTDGWRYDTAPDMTSMDEQTLAALVDEAHKNGIRVLTHTVSLAKAKVAARAGVNVIAHGVGDASADQELAQLMRSKNVSYAPTLAVYEPRGRNIYSALLDTVLDPLVKAAIQPPLVSADGRMRSGEELESARPEPSVDPERARLNREARERRWRNLLHNASFLRESGINIATGTDAGVTGTHHGWGTLRELQLLVQGGLTPMEAIMAGTLNAARALGVDSDRGTISVGRLADLVLIDGQPHRQISDIERINRVFLGGRELDREKLAKEIGSREMTRIAAVKAEEKLDDFERGDGRSQINTLWVNGTDSGHDKTKMVFGRTLKKGNDHALSVMARMSEKDNPAARAILPLSRGAVEPVDAKKFKGVQFECRGDGDYRIVVHTREVRDNTYFQTMFRCEPQWKPVKVSFDSLRQDNPRMPAKWSGADLLMLIFEVQRARGELGWFEIDNVRFYK